MPMIKVKAHKPNERSVYYLLDFINFGIWAVNTSEFLLFYERYVSENHLPIFNTEGFATFYVDLLTTEIDISIRVIKRQCKPKPKNLFCKEYLEKQKANIKLAAKLPKRKQDITVFPNGTTN